MCDSWNVLIVSSHLENGRALMRILDGLPVNAIVSRTLAQAQEVLARQEVHIVFCDDSLPDGTYRDFCRCGVSPNHASWSRPTRPSRKTVMKRSCRVRLTC